MSEIELKIMASDSLGVRSMAHLVIVEGLRIFIDPGAALAPRRFGLPPHPLEYELLDNYKKKIYHEAKKSDIIIITHYHRDHYMFEDEYIDIYLDKTVILKDIKKEINWNQKRRGRNLIEKITNEGKSDILWGDGSQYNFGELRIELSKPVWHGMENSKVGKILLVNISLPENNYIYASDSQGPLNKESLKWIIDRKPKRLFVSGLPTYLSDIKIPKNVIDLGFSNLYEIMSHPEIKEVILDHHIIRDPNYIGILHKINEKFGGKALTAAKFMGKKDFPLEIRRRELWETSR